MYFVIAIICLTVNMGSRENYEAADLFTITQNAQKYDNHGNRASHGYRAGSHSNKSENRYGLAGERISVMSTEEVEEELERFLQEFTSPPPTTTTAATTTTSHTPGDRHGDRGVEGRDRGSLTPLLPSPPSSLNTPISFKDWASLEKDFTIATIHPKPRPPSPAIFENYRADLDLDSIPPAEDLVRRAKGTKVMERVITLFGDGSDGDLTKTHLNKSGDHGNKSHQGNGSLRQVNGRVITGRHSNGHVAQVTGVIDKGAALKRRSLDTTQYLNVSDTIRKLKEPVIQTGSLDRPHHRDRRDRRGVPSGIQGKGTTPTSTLDKLGAATTSQHIPSPLSNGHIPIEGAPCSGVVVRLEAPRPSTLVMEEPAKCGGKCVLTASTSSLPPSPPTPPPTHSPKADTASVSSGSKSSRFGSTSKQIFKAGKAPKKDDPKKSDIKKADSVKVDQKKGALKKSETKKSDSKKKPDTKEDKKGGKSSKKPIETAVKESKKETKSVTKPDKKVCIKEDKEKLIMADNDTDISTLPVTKAETMDTDNQRRGSYYDNKASPSDDSGIVDDRSMDKILITRTTSHVVRSPSNVVAMDTYDNVDHMSAIIDSHHDNTVVTNGNVENKMNSSGWSESFRETSTSELLCPGKKKKSKWSFLCCVAKQVKH